MKPFLENCEILNWHIFSFKSFVLLKKKNCYVTNGMDMGVQSWIFPNGNESCLFGHNKNLHQFTIFLN